MSNVNANINISIDSSQALGQLRALQNQISTFNQSVVAGNVAAMQAQRDMTRNLTAQINATKGFTTSITNVESSVSRLGRAIDKNKLSLHEYFRYGIAASGKMGSGMREHAAIMELAGERVKRLQTQYIALEQAHNGYTRSLAVRPTNLFNADSAIAIQRQQIFNKLLGDGSTALVNWGKNTQWAGRQLMVGFTVPLTIFGGIAGKIFMDLEKQVVQFKRVYGDLATPMSERNAMVEEVKALAKEFTKYGIAVSDTVGLAAKAAATGAQGEDLIAATTQATRLATLGQIDYQQALDATISLQTALGVSSGELADATNFLNAVENQTVTSLDDITQAIPLVAPVVKGLGGDVKDLAIFMTAMREGGISANEGANALKSGLASLINPTRGAREQLEKVGINIDSILSKNKGDLRGLVMEFGEALGTLGKFERQQTLAKMFGKYQFSRMGALFSNISKEGSQAARVMDLTAMSAKELGQIAEGELGQLEESVGVKFTAAVEKLKLAIAPIGEAFLKIATPIIDFAAKIADAFNNLPDAAKTFITWGTAIGGVLVPTVIMLVGLLGNFAGNMLKIGAAIGRLMGKTNGLSSGLEYLTMEELDATAAAASLEGQTNTLTAALNVQRRAVGSLVRAYGNYVAAAGTAAANLPQGFRGPMKGMATGGFVAGSGNKDSEPALLMPGEFVVNKKAAQANAPLLMAMNTGKLKGYASGTSLAHVGSAITAVPGSSGAPTIEFAKGAHAAGNVLIEVAKKMGLEVGYLRNLVFTMDHEVNNALSRGEQGLVDFAVKWDEFGPQKWQPTLEQAGISFREFESEIADFDKLVMNEARQVATATAESKLPSGAKLDPNSVMISDPDIDAGYLRAREKLVASTTMEASKRDALVKALDYQYETISGVRYKFKEEDRIRAMLNDDLEVYDADTKRLISVTDKSITEQERLAIATKNLAEAKKGLVIKVKGEEGSFKLDRRIQSERKVADVIQGGAVRQSYTKANRGSGRETKLRAVSEIAASVSASGTKSGTAFASAFGEALRAQLGKRMGGIKQAVMFAAISGVDKNDVVAFLNAAGFSDGTIKKHAAKLGEYFDEGFTQTARSAVPDAINANRNSPDPSVPKAGRQDGAAYKVSFKDAAGNVRQVALGGYLAAGASPYAPQPVSTVDTSAQGGVADSSQQAATTTEAVGREGGKVANGLRTFGRALVRGSAKLTGAMFALDGVVFGLSMMDNGLGEFAQKIMPAVFALQGIQMIMPMLMTPFGAVVAGLAAIVGSVWYMKKLIDDVSDASREFSNSMTGTSDKINELAKSLNRETWGQKLADLEQSRIPGGEASDATKTKAAEFIGTETGQAIVENIKSVMQTSGQSGATQALKNQLERAVLSGAMPLKLANQVALEVGKQLGNTKLSVDVAAQMREIMGPDGSSLKTQEGRLQIYADIFADLQDPNKLQKSVSDIWNEQGALGKFFGNLTGQGEATIMAQQLAGAVGEGMKVLNEEYDRNLYLMAQGKISFTEFVENQKSISSVAQDQRLGWEGAQKSLENYYSNAPGDAAKAVAAFKSQMIAQQVGKIRLELDPASQQEVIDNINKTVLSTGGAVNVEDAGLYNDQLQKITQELEAQAAFVKQAEDARGKSWFDEKGLTDAKARLEDLKTQLSEMRSLQDFSLDVSVALSSGTVTPETLQALLEGKTEDEKREIKLVIGALPSDTAQNVLALLEMSGGDEATMDFIINVAARGGDELNNLYATLQALSVANINPKVFLDLPPEERQEALDFIYDNLVKFDKLPKNSGKKRYAEFFAPNYEMTKAQMDQFMALPQEQKRYFTTVFTAFFAEGGSMAAKNYLIQKGLLTSSNSGQIPVQAQQEWAADEAFDEIVGDQPEVKDPTPTTPSGSGGNTGGGTKEDPLAGYKEMWKNLSDQLRMYTNIEKVLNKLKGKKKTLEYAMKEKAFGFSDSLVQNMRKSGMSEAFIADLLSKGYKEAKKIFDTLKKRGKLDAANAAFLVGGAAQTTSDFRAEARLANTQKVANAKLSSMGGISDEARKSIVDDPVKAQQFVKLWQDVQNKVKGAQKRLWDMARAAEAAAAGAKDLKEELTVDERADLAISMIDRDFERQRNALEKAHDAEVKRIEKRIKDQEDLKKIQEEIIDGKEEEIDDLERLNDLDQQRIEGYNRDIEMQNRKAEGLKREDEIRQRSADALQRELEVMSRAEQSIRDAYQKRIDALDQVARLNDRILQAQQDQLNIGKALSEGDVYAAAQAAAEMQRNSAQYAADQNRAALEQGMENQIGGLRTGGGLSRQQAEAQIQAIQDQSYQTSLQIRDIEDYIYNLKQTKILPLEDAIYTRSLSIRDLQNEIYDINELQIEPIEAVVKGLEKELEAANAIFETNLADIKVGKLTLEMWEDKKQALEDAKLAAELLKGNLKSVEDAYKAIEAAAAEAKKAMDSVSATPSGVAPDGISATAAQAMGIENPFNFAWSYNNSGGMIKKYAAGSVVGSGGGDTVSAMLTPGEYVIRKSMVDKYGLPLFEDINQGSFSMPKYGGFGKQVASVASGGKSGGSTTVAPVYNTYSVNVNASTNASPDDIANTVINKIRSIESMSVRRINGY